MRGVRGQGEPRSIIDLKAIMHLGNAISAHDEWKARFRAAISQRETIDAATVSADDGCALGQWLHGEGKALFGNLPSHTDCVATHRVFHEEAGKIAAAINAKDFDEAHGMLEAHTPFSETSNQLATAILRLKQDALGSGGFTSLIAKLSE